MIGWGITLLWFGIGLWLARRRFDAIMGNSARTQRDMYNGTTTWTHTFTVAFWLALVTLFAWPMLYPIQVAVFQETSYERLTRQKKEQLELEQKFKRLEAEVANFGKQF